MRVRFDRFTVDGGTRQLLRDGQALHLTPKAFDLLGLLLERRPNVVSKPDLHARIWPGVAVTDASLNVLVRELRQVLGDAAERQQFVRTAARVGYAFCGNAVDIDLVASTSPPGWLVWRGKPLPVSDGDNVLGRGAGCDVQVDDESVSRHHARIRVDKAAMSATLEDLRSTNGTYLGRTKVRTAMALADGDTIRLGTATLKVRLWSTGEETETTRVRRPK
jgi:DNA-binding winged helix-turn-helix (wHTH) protein